MYISLVGLTVALAPLFVQGCSHGSQVARRQVAGNTLSVKLEAPSSVPNLDALVIKTLVTNTGSKPLKVLSANSPLSSAPTRDFTFTGVNGTADGTFGGIQLILTMDDPAITNSFVDIAPGATITTEHPAGANYDLSVGTFSVQSSTEFFSAELGPEDPTPTSWAEMTTQDVQSEPITVNIQGVQRRWVPALHSRAELSCADNAKESFIEAAYAESKQLASLAADFITANPRDPLVTTYFGSASTASVTRVFNAVANEAGNTPVGCVDALNACEGGVIAYTLTRTGAITMCPIFFQEVPVNQLCTGETSVRQRNVAAGTVLHEFTHSLSKTDDLGYGVTFDKSLAGTPSRALINADSYNVLATEIFAASSCNSTSTGSSSSSSSSSSSGRGRGSASTTNNNNKEPSETTREAPSADDTQSRNAAASGASAVLASSSTTTILAVLGVVGGFALL